MAGRKAQSECETFTLSSAARLLGIAPSTVRLRILAGQLAAERDLGRWVIYLSAIQEYRARRSFRPNAGQSGSEASGAGVAPLTTDERGILAKYGIDL